MVIVSEVEEFRISHGDPMEQNEWGLVHDDIQHPSIVMTQGFSYYSSSSLDILARWWFFLARQQFNRLRKIDHRFLSSGLSQSYSLYWRIWAAWCENTQWKHVTQSVTWSTHCDFRGFSHLCFLLISSHVLSSTSELWAHICSPDTSLKPGLESGIIDVARFPESQLNTTSYTLQRYGEILIYIIAHFPPLQSPERVSDKWLRGLRQVVK